MRWFPGPVDPPIKSTLLFAELADPPLVDELKDRMLGHREPHFDFEHEDVIAGYLHRGTYYLSEGHHRINAALEILWETGDRTCLDRLLERGEWRQRMPSVTNPLPTRTVISRLRAWFRWYWF